MSSLSRTAIIDRPMPVRRNRPTTSVVTRARRSTGSSMLRRFEKSMDPMTGGSSRGVLVPNCDPVNNGRRNSQLRAHHRERERDDRQEQPTDAERRNADDHGCEHADEHRDDHRRQPRHVKAHVHAVERNRDVVAFSQHDERQRAEPDERELPERELSGPARERCDRQPRPARRSAISVQRKSCDCCVRNSGEHEQEAEEHGEPDHRQPAHVPERLAAGPGSASTCVESDQPVVVAAVPHDEA